MHPELAAVLSDPEVPPPGRLLYATLFAHTNGTGRASMPVDELLTALAVTSLSVLRRYRGQIAAYAVTELHDGILSWQLLSVHDMHADSVHDMHTTEEVCTTGAPDDEEVCTTGALDEEGACTTGAPGSDSVHHMHTDTAGACTTGAPNGRKCAPQARSPVVDAQLTPRTPHGIVNTGGGGGSTTTTAERGLGKTDHAANVADALLRQQGISPAEAVDLVRRFGPRHIEQHVRAWEREQSRPDAPGVGALIHRIRNWPTPRDRKPPASSAGYDVPAEFEHIIKH